MKPLTKYGNKRFSLLHAHLEKYGKRTNPEELHRIRIEFKKIKNLIDLITFNTNKFKSGLNYKPLRKIFREAGRIREVDVLRELVREYKLKKFEKDIIPDKIKIIRDKHHFQEKTGQFEKTINDSYDKVIKYLKKINRKDLRKYILKSENKLRNKLIETIRQEELHKLRKQMKKVIFLSQIINAGVSSQKIKLYNRLQEIIGQWHDKKVLICLLKKNRNNSGGSVIKKLRSGCAKDMKSIKPLLITLNQK